jgi:hypothetical protein
VTPKLLPLASLICKDISAIQKPLITVSPLHLSGKPIRKNKSIPSKVPTMGYSVLKAGKCPTVAPGQSNPGL